MKINKINRQCCFRMIKKNIAEISISSIFMPLEGEVMGVTGRKYINNFYKFNIIL